MDIKNYYNVEIETQKGTIYTKGTDFDSKVIRISFLPNIIILPRHDIIFSDYKYIKRFGRGFLKQAKGMKEYLYCIITDKFRFYIRCSNGSCLVTNKDYELYL